MCAAGCSLLSPRSQASLSRGAPPAPALLGAATDPSQLPGQRGLCHPRGGRRALRACRCIGPPGAGPGLQPAPLTRAEAGTRGCGAGGGVRVGGSHQIPGAAAPARGGESFLAPSCSGAGAHRGNRGHWRGERARLALRWCKPWSFLPNLPYYSSATRSHYLPPTSLIF